MKVGCRTHGDFDPRKEWGCPECVIQSRRLLRRIKAAMERWTNCPFCEIDFDLDTREPRGKHEIDCPYDELMKMELVR